MAKRVGTSWRKLAETQLPEDVTTIVTNPPYGRRLFEFVDQALELTRPARGMVAILINTHWQTGAANSIRLRHPAFEASVMLTNRIVWFPGDDGRPAASPQENHCWLVWDWSRTPGPARLMFASNQRLILPPLAAFTACPLSVYFCPFYDTVGESFELNVAAAQEAGTLIGTAKPIILAQGSVWKNWNYSNSRTT
jgi:hypothetical protein